MISTDVSDLPPDKSCYEVEGYTIYSLVNLDNGKRYIGRSKYPKQRLKAHFYQIENHRHANPLINSESDCRFGYEILEEHISFDQRTDKEREYMVRYKTYDEEYGYNGKDSCIQQEKKDAKSLSNRCGSGVRQTCTLGVRGNESPTANSDKHSKENEHIASGFEQETAQRKF